MREQDRLREWGRERESHWACGREGMGKMYCEELY